jgi:radical SAM family uncharacterized protein/radical SAM-linked protein
MTNDSSSSYSRGPGDNSSTGIEHIMPRVQKPAQYIGREINSARKDPGQVRVRMALAFPDVYEIGMSHLGLKILYAIVNARPDLAAERVFAPWADMEQLLRSEGIALASLESGIPLRDFDMIGFSLQYELCVTTVLQMLDLGRVPLRSSERGDGDPFVVGGGPLVFNPAPLAPFFDAFAVGDGEDLITELADALIEWKSKPRPREQLLRAWKDIPGVYAPSLHSTGETVRRRILPDINAARFPSAPVVPFCEIVHDRVGVEIARGCTRGCRFCQAGMIYRPVRERSPEAIIDLAETTIRSTGWSEVALLSLSSGDYSCIGELIREMARRFSAGKVALSLPSLRTETFDPEMAEQIRRVRKTGFTLAPEAGTDRLRRVINKGNTEEDLRRALSAAFGAGWQSVKLYFMIGLPGETDEDLDGIIDLIHKASKWAGGKKITVSVSTFVPKAHTPFQWAEQISAEETRRRQRYIAGYFRKGRAQVKFHDAAVSFLEGVLARGDDKLSTVIEKAYFKGARFDGWTERFRPGVWTEAFDECGIDPQSYLLLRRISDELPWSFIDAGVNSDYLAAEWEKAARELATPDCRFGGCQDCGVCDFASIRPITALEGASTARLSLADQAAVMDGPSIDAGRAVDSARPAHGGGLAGTDSSLDERTSPTNDQPQPAPVVRRFLLRYGKIGRMRFLGHRDIIRLFERAFRRAGVLLDHSKGFHPHPKLRFSAPLSVGLESLCEYLEFDVVRYTLGVGDLLQFLRDNLPRGVTPAELNEVELKADRSWGNIDAATYRISPTGFLAPSEVADRVEGFHTAHTFCVDIKRVEKLRRLDLKEWVYDLKFSGPNLILTLKVDSGASVNPLDAVAAILGCDPQDVRRMRILKESVQRRPPDSWEVGGFPWPMK